MMSAVPYRAIRVGVTGARKLDPESRPLIERAVVTALALIREQVTKEAASEQPLLRLISPLAEGADRLVAQLAIGQGYRLEAIFPFAIEDYRRDFSVPVTPGVSPVECQAEFDDLLVQAAGVLELDGHRDTESASYEAVGRAVIRNSDVVIAVWDGAPGAGRGGTADTVRFALDQGVPVWWVKADTGETSWLTEMAGVSVAVLEKPTSCATAGLARYLSDIFDNSPTLSISCQNRTPRQAPNGVLGTPLRGLTDTPRRHFWHSAYGIFERQLTRGIASEPYPKIQDLNERCWTYWKNIYNKENFLANYYMSAYRSAYVIIFTIAAIILSMEALSTAWPDRKHIFKFIEVILMGLVAILVSVGGRQGWHMRAISHRLSAEMARMQSFLSLFAGSIIVNSNVDEINTFHIYKRATPMKCGRIDFSYIKNSRDIVIAMLAVGQEIYHRNKRNKMAAASERLTKTAKILFSLGFFAASAEFVTMTLLNSEVIDSYFSILGASLTAFAAFAMGIRSYAELEILADQSTHMEKFMRSARRKLESFDCSAPNASQAIGDFVHLIAIKMLEDIQGWSTVSRSKALEAG